MRTNILGRGVCFKKVGDFEHEQIFMTLYFLTTLYFLMTVEIRSCSRIMFELEIQNKYLMKKAFCKKTVHVESLLKLD